MTDPSTGSSWLAIYTRAVVTPAWNRAAAIWLGCAFVVAVAFGGNGMHPRDLTTMAAEDPLGIGAILVAIWLLVFLPVARVLVREEPARWLRSLPHGRVGPRLVVGGALVALQLPWVALWLLGAREVGVIVIAATTLVLVALSLVRAPALRAHWPGWRTPLRAFAAMHRAAVLRRGGDTLLRGAGIAALAGVLGGLFVRNNGLHGLPGAILGASVATIALVPARVGVLAVALDTHRRSAWLAASSGAGSIVRLGALAAALLVVHVLTALVAIGAGAIVIRDATTTASWGALQLAIAGCSAVFEMRVVDRATDAPNNAPLVGGALAGAALAALALGMFGLLGILALAAATGLYALSESRTLDRT